MKPITRQTIKSAACVVNESGTTQALMVGQQLIRLGPCETHHVRIGQAGQEVLTYNSLIVNVILEQDHAAT